MIIKYISLKFLINPYLNQVFELYKNNIDTCEQILSQLNPQFAKDKERDDRLFNLENRFDGVESKLDKIFNLINK